MELFLLTFFLFFLLFLFLLRFAMTADTVAMETPMNRDECVAIHWFRHGLRIHDNPALLEAISKAKTLYPVFIFDGKVAGTWNRLEDLQ